MNRRILAAVLALGLAIVGTVVLVSYVRGADARALEGVQTTPVLVVTAPVPEGTPAAELAGSVRLEQIPAKVAATGSVSDLADLGDRVSTVALQPGEQLLASRFAAEESLQPPDRAEVPPGFSEVSLLLEPQRVIGGRLAAGDEIGVYISMDLEDANEKKTGTTHSVLHGVLVTQVQGAPAPAQAAEGSTKTVAAGAAAPSNSLMVTVALPARDAEKVVFGMEHASVWLALEPEGADNAGTGIVTQNNIYGDALAGLTAANGGSGE
ncbi:RcpC/CpaB family pilus assembly protein [Blastococcus sp. HT6-30]|uniref:Flp pilus assembly protein CpaB n=1 Tax=Blastococcus sp. HT6-30 TaxID=3144843 RepID=UPI00321901A9